jgi:N-acetyl-anhydromuramoyl-L-alanine amidase
MKVNLTTGLLEHVPFVPSPNFNQRPTVGDISLIVIHGISLPAGKFGGDEVLQLFTNCYGGITDRVSAHLFIRRDGSIIQFVPFHLRAWHAGVSVWQNRENCNDYSIGIELEGTDTLPYEEEQYQVLSQVISALIQVYPAINHERIVGHSDIAPGRKTDPGPAFCWEKIL